MEPILTGEVHKPFRVPIDGKKTNLIGEYRRYEDKFLVPLSKKEIFLEVLMDKMNLSYLNKGTKFTLVESLYLDSGKFDFFQHHFLSLDKRYKMRVRRYGPDGVWNKESYLLEVKRKRQGESKKTRFMISPEDYENLKIGKTLSFSSTLKTLNPTLKTKTILKRLAKVNDLILTYSLRPVLSVQYHRVAFEKEGFRVTVDHNLKAQEIDSFAYGDCGNITKLPLWEKAELLLGKYHSEEKFIMELKHQGDIPSWMEKLLDEHLLEKTGFSKYCWFTASRIRREATMIPQNKNGAINQWNLTS